MRIAMTYRIGNNCCGGSWYGFKD